MLIGREVFLKSVYFYCCYTALSISLLPSHSLFNVSLKILDVLIYFVWLLFDVYLNEKMNRNRYYFPIELILESKILVCCILNAYGLSV